MTTTLVLRTFTATRTWSDHRFRCQSCGDRFLSSGPVCCWACIQAGYCTICAEQHRPTSCPKVAKIKHVLEQQARARVAARVAAILARYEAQPIDADPSPDDDDSTPIIWTEPVEPPSS